MFERFFHKNRDKIREGFPTKLLILLNPVLDIIVNNNNITRITYEYINSTINMDAPDTNIYITFKKRSEGLPPLTAAYDLYYIGFRLLTINVPCDEDDNSSLTYVVYKGTSREGELIVEGRCPVVQSTKRVSSYKSYPIG
jgi:hypothetical protein